jgi:MFS family permease
MLPMIGAMLFSFATATAKDIQTIMITRFFTGVFASAPLCNVGGMLADVWAAGQRAAAMLGYGFAVVVGPIIAPIVSGALVVNLEKTGWRWTEYVSPQINSPQLD